MAFILRWLVTALSVGAAVWLVPGISIIATTDTWIGVALMSLILALLNMSIKPILQVLSLPITVLTLGIFYLVVNTFLIYAASWIANGMFNAGFTISSFGSAFVASLVISVVSSLLGGITGSKD